MTAGQQHAQVLVVGTGIAELVGALEFAKYGVSVTIIEQLGEQPHTPIAGQSDPEGVLAQLITEVGAPLRGATDTACTPVRTTPGATWVSPSGDWQGDWIRVPDGSAFGIPSSPLSTQMVQALGAGAALRAYLDRLKPVLAIGKAQFAAPLVEKRLGRKVLDAFVEPIVQHLFGRAASAVEVSELAPGLNEAYTRAGSLTGAALAYSDRYAELAGVTLPNIGWVAFRHLLRQRLTAYGATWVTLEGVLDVRVASDVDAEAGAPRVTIDCGSEMFSSDFLIQAQETSPELRVEISCEHDEATFFPEAGHEVGAQGIRTLRDLPGWTARTTRAATGGFVTELRSSVVTDFVIATTESLTAAGLEPDAVRNVQVRVGAPLRAHDEPDEQTDQQTELVVIDTQVAVSERGLAQTIARNAREVQRARRDLLGLE